MNGMNGVKVNVDGGGNLAEMLKKLLKLLGRMGKDTGKASKDFAQLSESTDALRKGLLEAAEAHGVFVKKAVEAGKAAKDQTGHLEQLRTAMGDYLRDSEEALRKNTFVAVKAREAFEGFARSTDAALADLLFVRFRNNTDKFLTQWDRFVRSMKDTFMRALAKMAAGIVEQSLVAPFANLAQRALGLEVKGSPLGTGGLLGEVASKGVSAAGSAALGALGIGGGATAASTFGASAGLSSTVVPAVGQAGFVAAGGSAAASAAAGGTAAAGAGAAAAGAGTSSSAGLIAGLGGAGAAAALGGGAALALALTLNKRMNTPKNTPEMSGAANIAEITRLGKLAGLSATGNVQSSSDPNFRPSIEEVIRRTGGNRQAARKILAPFLTSRIDDGDGAQHGAFALGPARLNVGERGRAEAIVPLEDERGLCMMTEVMVRALKRSGVSGGGGSVAYNVDLRGAFLPDERSVERLFRLLEEKCRRTRRIDLGRA